VDARNAGSTDGIALPRRAVANNNIDLVWLIRSEPCDAGEWIRHISVSELKISEW